MDLSYLHRTSLEQEEEFEPDEMLFRRCFRHENPSFPKEFFSSMRSEDFEHGLSVNRSKFCLDREHVRYLDSYDKENEKCVYILREKSAAVECAIKDVRTGIDTELFKANVHIQHDPVLCNYSHSLVLFDPKPASKAEKIAVKTFLNNQFRFPELSP